MADYIDRDAALASISAALNNATGDLYDAYAAIRALPAVTVGVKDFDIEVVRGNTGGNLALYFNDYRVAGSKPWGGGTTIHKFRVQGDDAKSSGILATIWDFQTVPVVKECLTTDAALPAAIRIGRNGEHLFKTAESLGWKDDGEGALEFVMRRTREVALEDADPAAIREAALREALASAEYMANRNCVASDVVRAILALIDKEPGNG